MPPVGFEPTISANERPQTHVIDRAATGTGGDFLLNTWNIYFFHILTVQQSLIYLPTDAPVSCLKNRIKMYIKIYIKTATTCFGVTVAPSSGSASVCIFNLNDAIPLCRCNIFYCKVPSVHNNWISVVVLQQVNQSTCFGRFFRPSSGLKNNIF